MRGIPLCYSIFTICNTVAPFGPIIFTTAPVPPLVTPARTNLASSVCGTNPASMFTLCWFTLCWVSMWFTRACTWMLGRGSERSC